MRPAVTAELRQTPATERGSRVRTAVLLVLAVAVPLLVVAWIAGIGFGRTETDKADLRLETEGRAAAAVFVRSVTEADRRAGQLAASRELQQALATRDRAAVEKLVRPGEVVYAGNTLFVGRPTSPAVHRSVSVSIDGTPLGAVTVDVPLNDALLAELRAAAGPDANDRLALIQDERTIAGAPSGAGAVPVGRAADVTLAGSDYRTFGVNLVGPPTDVALVAATPRSGISGGVHNRMRWTVLAVLLTLVTVGVLGYAGAPMLARRDRSVAVLGGSERDEHAVTLVGDALASTHDPDRLLPVILHATMEATGAARGRVLQDGRVTAEEGSAGDGRPLRLVLDDDESVGEVALEIWPAGGSFDGRTRTLAKSLAAQAAIALENARLHSIVQRQAITDELTELANRRHFTETLDTELRRAERFGEPLGLVFADLDDFKHVNDRYGHQAGDRVLRAFGDCLRKRVRVIDIAARLGGEEFAVLLVETDLAGATALAESLREAVSSLDVPVGEKETLALTASFGVAAYPEARTSEELLAAADAGLYRAKREGKNRVRSDQTFDRKPPKGYGRFAK
jgi:diguanylate cyclase (GGDEF)-like protein